MPVTWFDGVTITVEAALSAATATYGAWNSGKWNTALWGPDEIYVDISNYVRSFKIDRTFARETQGWNPGTASVVLSNRDARFDPDNLSGPYVTSGVTGIRPERPIRITATYAGITYPLYAGYITDWTDTWADAHADAYVTLPCVDAMSALGEVDGIATAPVGAGELAGARVHRLLDSADHRGPRNIMLGRNTMQDTDLSMNVAAELKLVEDSEGGGLWVDADGTVVFEDQYALMEQARSTVVQATFSDGSDSNLPCADITPNYGRSLIRNSVSYQRVGGTPQLAFDEASRALYKLKQQSRTDLICETDAQALALASFYLEQHKQPAKAFNRIRVLPRNVQYGPRLWPQVLGRRPRDLVQVNADPIGTTTKTRACHISGIHHDVSPGTWVTDFDLWDATVFQTYANARWDIGRWDNASWFF